MENPLIAAETVRKASLSNLHTHEATGSSPVVSTKNHRNHLIPVIFFHNLQLFWMLNFCRFSKTNKLAHTGNGKESTGPVFSAHLLADDAADGFQNFIMRPSKGVRVIHGSGLGRWE